jgi:hypothetical protein
MRVVVDLVYLTLRYSIGVGALVDGQRGARVPRR